MMPDKPPWPEETLFPVSPPPSSWGGGKEDPEEVLEKIHATFPFTVEARSTDTRILQTVLFIPMRKSSYIFFKINPLNMDTG